MAKAATVSAAPKVGAKVAQKAVSRDEVKAAGKVGVRAAKAVAATTGAKHRPQKVRTPAPPLR